MTGVVTTAVIKDGNGAPIAGGVRMLDSSGTGAGPNVPMQVPSDLNGNAIDLSQPSQVVGSVASGSTDSGNPVKTGGVAWSNPGSAAQKSDGQRAEIVTGSKGVQWAAIIFNSSPADGLTNANGGGTVIDGNGNVRRLENWPYIFNGTSWDRDRKPNSVSRIASSAASNNATLAKASAGDVCNISGYNANAAVRYLKLYNKASAPSPASDTPFAVFALPPTATFNYQLSSLYFSTGIAYALVTGSADNDNTSVGAGDILGLNITYA